MSRMKLLLDCSENSSTREAATEILAGQLITPLTGYSQWAEVYAIDNGAYTQFDETRFAAILKRQSTSPGCLWVSCPDIVGSGRRTLELFKRRHKWIGPGWKVALVAQDGLEDLEVPWDDLHCLFVGGTDRFKCSQASIDLIKTAKTLGKMTHAGRVNDATRWKFFDQLGVDTCDGSGLARYDHMIQRLLHGIEQPELFPVD